MPFPRPVQFLTAFFILILIPTESVALIHQQKRQYTESHAGQKERKGKKKKEKKKMHQCRDEDSKMTSKFIPGPRVFSVESKTKFIHGDFESNLDLLIYSIVYSIGS